MLFSACNRWIKGFMGKVFFTRHIFKWHEIGDIEEGYNEHERNTRIQSCNNSQIKKTRRHIIASFCALICVYFLISIWFNLFSWLLWTLGFLGVSRLKIKRKHIQIETERNKRYENGIFLYIVFGFYFIAVILFLYWIVHFFVVRNFFWLVCRSERNGMHTTGEII